MIVAISKIVISYQFLSKIVISYLGPEICDILPDDYKTIQIWIVLRLKLKKWKSENFCEGYGKFTLID